MATCPWTHEERVLAEKILAEAKKYQGTFITVHSLAAEKHGYKNYNGLPEGVKKFISHLGAEKRIQNNLLKEKAKQVDPTQKNKSGRKKAEKIDTGGLSLLEQWAKDIVTSTSMQHGLHPEDEQHLLPFLKNA